MRPTYLDFRNPKERTPEFYTPIVSGRVNAQVTHDGRKLYESALVEPVVPSRKKRVKARSMGFTTSQRFGYFKVGRAE